MIDHTTQAGRFCVRAGAGGRSTGFTLIELMIVVGVIAVILALALPAYGTFSIRAKLGEALSVAAAAKTAVASTCVENPLLDGLTNSKVGYGYKPSKWVQSVNASGDCTEPVITVATQNTGAPVGTNIILTGNLETGGQSITWTCTSNAADHLVPKECRSGV